MEERLPLWWYVLTAGVAANVGWAAARWWLTGSPAWAALTGISVVALLLLLVFAWGADDVR
jgi:hypothetical protein